MTVTIRSEAEPTPATLVIHMGAGAAESVVSAAVRNYGEYRALALDGREASSPCRSLRWLAVSAKRRSSRPSRSAASRSSVGAVTGAGFGLLATSIADADLDPAIAAIQHVHFDIVLLPPMTLGWWFSTRLTTRIWKPLPGGIWHPTSSGSSPCSGPGNVGRVTGSPRTRP